MSARLGCALAFALAACGDPGGPDAAPRDTGPGPLGHLTSEVAAEVTATSAILQSRLTRGGRDRVGDVRGAPGVARFEVATDDAFLDPIRTEWVTARAETDFVVRAAVDGLRPATRYRWRLVFGPDTTDVSRGAVRAFTTLPRASERAPARVAVVSCLHLDRFLASPRGRGPDGDLGYPGLAAVRDLAPELLVLDGDVLYYDFPPNAMDVAAMRVEWHRQLTQPRMIELLGSVASVWAKDDHDYRFDDADPFDDRLPSAADGAAVWREQVPTVEPTYRAIRVGALLELFVLESREHRSPNDAPDDADKSLWGTAQRAWLESSLLASDAVFRVIVTPTPLVGPDDLRKNDNHTNVGGFRSEGESFLAWMRDQGLPDAGVLVVTGDRHWQYHSVHATGVEELSVGALVEGNARVGVAPGDPEGTDPDATIEQRYTSPEPTGGFLVLDVSPEGDGARLRAELRDEDGAVLYAIERAR